METIVECWNGCGEEFTAVSPSRGSDELTEGVTVSCSNCAHSYLFTVDGDGEPDLQDATGDGLGQNISGVDSDRSTNF